MNEWGFMALLTSQVILSIAIIGGNELKDEMFL
jgi:hypothetical protein